MRMLPARLSLAGRWRAGLLTALSLPALAVLPVITPATASAHAVRSTVATVPVAGVDAAVLSASAQASGLDAARSAHVARPLGPHAVVPQRPAVLTKAMHTAPFSLVGVSWDRTATAATYVTLVRTHAVGGGWSGWSALDAADATGQAEGTSATARTRQGTDPSWAGPSDGVQVRLDVVSGPAPRHVTVDLVDPGSSRYDAQVDRAPASRAAAAASRPTILTRAQWGADESLRSSPPVYMDTIKAGVLHHTDGVNGYSSAQVPAIIRGIYAYHTKSLGWSDIGYNFLVDRFGRTWEGRWGGIDRAVRGAHAGGFNEDTVGVSVLGNYDSVAPSAATVDAVSRLFAWKLGQYYRDPLGTTKLTSAGTSYTAYPAGTVVTRPVIMGHRDLDQTSCPGKYLYAQLPTIRNKAAAYLQAGLVGPAVSAASGPPGSGVTVTAGFVTTQSWTLTITEQCTGRPIRTYSGTGSRTAPLRLAWDGRTAAGAPARVASFTLTLTSRASSGAPALTWSGAYETHAPSAPVAGAPTLGADAGYVPLTPARLLDTRSGDRLGPFARTDLQVAGVGGVPATGVTGVVLNVTSVCPSGDATLTVWPAGTAQPLASSLNLRRGEVRAASVVVGLGTGGQVSIGNGGGFTDVVVDVSGYTTADPAASTLHPLSPQRLFDSRTVAGSALKGGATRTFTLPDVPGIPVSRITAAVLQLTVTRPQHEGYLRAWPAGEPVPTVSNVNFVAGETVANRAVVKVRNGSFDLQSYGADTDVVIDLEGVFALPDVSGGALFTPVTPHRLLDSRLSGGRLSASAPPRVLPVVGGDVPADARAVVVTVTEVRPDVATHLTVWPDGQPRPNTSDVNAAATDIVANTAVVPVGAGGAVDLAVGSHTSDVVVDVVGYFR